MLAQAAQASDVTTSNVPGPPIPLYLAGVRMVAAYPLVATIGAAVNITMVTYDGQAYIGVSADDRAVSDLDDLVEDLRAGFADGDRGDRSVRPIATRDTSRRSWTTRPAPRPPLPATDTRSH